MPLFLEAIFNLFLVLVVLRQAMSRLELVYSVVEDDINDWCSCFCIFPQVIGLWVWSTTFSYIYFLRVNGCNEHRIEKSGHLDVLQNGESHFSWDQDSLKGSFCSHFLHMALLRYFFFLYKHNKWGVHEVLRAFVLLTHTAIPRVPLRQGFSQARLKWKVKPSLGLIIDSDSA